jgi:hypothetical protein
MMAGEPLVGLDLRRSSPVQELPVISYRATLDVPRDLAQYLGRLLHAERRRRGTRRTTRVLTCFGQAVLGLRWFRQDVDVCALARDHGISRATGYRYLDEVITVLAEQAPDLHDAVRRAKDDSLTHLILDGKVFSADRCGEQTTSVTGEPIDVWYSGKAHEHGGNIQALSAPSGFPLWVSEVKPGSVHDLTAAREHVLGALYWAASQLDLPTLADGGYTGAGIGVHTPVKRPSNGQMLHVDNRACNALLRGLRCLGERGFALLVGRWRTLRHITASPRKIGDIVKAALVALSLQFPADSWANTVVGTACGGLTKSLSAMAESIMGLPGAPLYRLERRPPNLVFDTGLSPWDNIDGQYDLAAFVAMNQPSPVRQHDLP